MRLTATGRTLPDLFDHAASQLLSVLLPVDDVGEALREKIVVEAADPNALLSAWINRLLEMARVQRMIFRRHQFQELTDDPARLRAESVGELFDPLRHRLRQPLEGF